MATIRTGTTRIHNTTPRLVAIQPARVGNDVIVQFVEDVEAFDERRGVYTGRKTRLVLSAAEARALSESLARFADGADEYADARSARLAAH